jgi:hypothetical protein
MQRLSPLKRDQEKVRTARTSLPSMLDRFVAFSLSVSRSFIHDRAMTPTRILLAGILGGIAMFIWTSLAHMALPLGESGVSEMKNEQAVLDAFQTNLGDRRGLYIFPGLGLGPNPSREEKHAAMQKMSEKLANSPSGLLMYFPKRPFNLAASLGIEAATEILEAILVVFLLAQTLTNTFAGRVGFVTVAGILAAIATNVSYWNWYGFPKRYTVASMFIEVVGFLVVGIVSALILRKNNAAATPV